MRFEYNREQLVQMGGSMDFLLQILASLGDLLQKIPDSVWGASVGGFIAYKVAASTNESHLEGLKSQLKSQEKENELNRKIDLRKDVYLSLVNETVGVSGILGSIGKLDVAKTDVSFLIRPFLGAAAQAMSIADQNTSLSIIELQTSVSKIFMEILYRLSLTSPIHACIAVEQEYYDRSQLEIKRILSQQTLMIESNAAFGPDYQSLMRSFDTQMKLSEKHGAERERLGEKLQQHVLDMCDYVTKNLDSVALKQLAVIVAIRTELRVDTDVALFAEKLSEQRVQAKKSLEEMIAKLHSGKS